jgi:hypothetical protein
MYGCEPDHSANILDLHGELFVQNGALVDLEEALQSANMSPFQSN